MRTAQPLPDALSADELEAAYREVSEPGWPSLTQLQHGLGLYHRVRACALRRRSTPAPVARIGPAGPTGPQACARQPDRRRPPSPSSSCSLDLKRLASGERPDDDTD